MHYIQQPQTVTAFQFPQDATVTFEGPASDEPVHIQLARGDWLVFLPNGEKRVVENKDFARQYHLAPPREPKPTGTPRRGKKAKSGGSSRGEEVSHGNQTF